MSIEESELKAGGPLRPLQGNEFPDVGDVAKMKTGGPRMMIGMRSDKLLSGVVCYWFDEEDNLHSEHIPLACLAVLRVS